MFDYLKEMITEVHTCSKHNFTGINQKCPECDDLYIDIIRMRGLLTEIMDDLEGCNCHISETLLPKIKKELNV